jgi:hypothetical protein
MTNATHQSILKVKSTMMNSDKAIRIGKIFPLSCGTIVGTNLERRKSDNR